jgi:hypothetical protein
LQALGRKKKKEARCVFEADSIRTCGPGLHSFFFSFFFVSCVFYPPNFT